MTKFGVRPEKEERLFKRLQELGIRDEDMEEKFIRSGGHGGQHLNKTSTCVQIKHIPTGIVVKSQRDRSQGVNRYLARLSLISKIEEKYFWESSPKLLKIEKIRKQKQRRKRKTNKKLELISTSKKI